MAKNLIGRVAVVLLAAAAGVFTAEHIAQAAPGIATIGPGPSPNTAGVLCIQRALHVTADGRFGDETYQAVKNFQRAHALSVDGAVGPATGEQLLRIAPAGCIDHIPSAESGPAPAPSSPSLAAPAGPKPDSVHDCGTVTCSTYYSHAASAEMDAWLAHNDPGKLTCDVAKRIASKSVGTVACAALKLGTANVRSIVHHAAISNGCVRFRSLRGTGDYLPEAVYADHSATCRSLD